MSVIRAPNIELYYTVLTDPDSKVHGANMGPIWGRQDPGGPHIGPMDSAMWGVAPGRCDSKSESIIFQNIQYITD